ncbi:hypothetical protein NKG05_08830 [Oerskovia sp. M15]
MSADETATTYESRLRDLLEHRMDAGRALAERAEQVAAAREQLDEAERDYAAAFSDALGAGGRKPSCARSSSPSASRCPPARAVARARGQVQPRCPSRPS